jgi:hypothetical protein
MTIGAAIPTGCEQREQSINTCAIDLTCMPDSRTLGVIASQDNDLSIFLGCSITLMCKIIICLTYLIYLICDHDNKGSDFQCHGGKLPIEYECQSGALLTASSSSLVHTFDVLLIQCTCEAAHLDPRLDGPLTLPRCSVQNMKTTTRTTTMIMKVKIIIQIKCGPGDVRETSSTTRMTMMTMIMMSSVLRRYEASLVTVEGQIDDSILSGLKMKRRRTTMMMTTNGIVTHISVWVRTGGLIDITAIATIRASGSFLS